MEKRGLQERKQHMQVQEAHRFQGWDRNLSSWHQSPHSQPRCHAASCSWRMCWQTLRAGHFIHMLSLPHTQGLRTPSFAQGHSAGKEQSVNFNHWVPGPKAHIPLTRGTASGKGQVIQCPQDLGVKVKVKVKESGLQGRQHGHQRAPALPEAL